MNGKKLVKASVIEAVDFFLTTTPDLLCILNQEGQFQYVNPAWEFTLGYSLDELCLRSCSSIMHPEDRDADEARHLGAPRCIKSFMHQDGRQVWLDWTSVYDPGSRVVYAIARDVTKQIEADERRQRLQQQIAHDMAMPLSVIRLFLEAKLESQEIPESVHAFVDRNLDRLMRLKDDARDISQVTSGRLHLHVTPVDLAAVCANAVLDLEPFADRRGVVLDFEAESAMVRGDKDRLGQVVTNLVHNAVKFSPQDSEVQIRCRPGANDARFSVTDHGPGITASEAQSLFIPFTQLENAHGTGEEGSGLGLFISKQLIEAHGGSVAVEHRLKGARFVFMLPLATDAREHHQTVEGTVAGRREP